MTIKLHYPKREIGVSHYPMPSSKCDEIIGENISFLNDSVQKGKELLLYIHIPFCEKMCSFCPYNKIILQSKKVEQYIRALEQEIIWYSQTKYLKERIVSAVYFGGGTPNLFTNEQMNRIMKCLKEHFQFSYNAEITVEGNPHLYSEEKMEVYRGLGVNRISLGVQTFQEKLAEIIEVPHSPLDAVTAIYNAQKAGFSKVSIDLMYNLPEQTMDMWIEDVKKAVKLNVDHITLFHLVLIPNSRLAQKITKMNYKVSDLETEVKMYEAAMQYLLDAGYEQESTYDFARKNKGSYYGELHYKHQAEILGLGVSAFGEVNGKTYINDGDFMGYIEHIENTRLPIVLQDDVLEEEKLNAKLSMGLRLIEVTWESLEEPKEEIMNRFAKQFNILQELNLIKIDNDKIALTQKGKVWGNNICKEFYSEEYKKKLPAWQRMEELAR